HDGKCAYCGAPADTIDHATPLARGGKHAISNLLPACKKCNFTKKTKTREEFMQDLERIG
ncbi:MAG: HNH endonuclease, partial [Salinibacterium sp.]